MSIREVGKIGRFLTLIFLTGTINTARANEALCFEVVDRSEVHELSRKFSEFYDVSFHPQTYSGLKEDYKLKFFDCGYAIIVETHARLGVFGAETGFFFRKNGFEFRDTILIE